MGNHNVGRAFASCADVFWGIIPEGTATQAQALKALETVGNRYRGADAEFDDELFDQNTPLGQMVALAFDAKPEELEDYDDGEAWYNGPITRFRQHFQFC
jgi:hypothetical protein